jgi:hypothetical protein
MLAWETGDSGSEAQSNPSSLTRPPLSEWLWRRVSEYLHALRYRVERENVQYPSVVLAKQRTGSRIQEFTPSCKADDELVLR